MKEIKRYKITSANGNSSNVTKCDDGHWVHYSDFRQLQAKIKELESDKHINEIKAQAIMRAVEYAAFDCTLHDDPVAVLEKVERYAKQLMEAK